MYFEVFKLKYSKSINFRTIIPKFGVNIISNEHENELRKSKRRIFVLILSPLNPMEGVEADL